MRPNLQEPPLGNGMGEFTITKLMMLPIQVNHIMHCSAFVQMLKAIMNGDFDAKAQVSVPSGLKSTGWSVRLQIIIHNQRAEAVHFWWIDYTSNPMLYGSIPSRGAVQQFTFGTHPWLITKTNGDLITYVVPNTSNLELTIQ